MIGRLTSVPVMLVLVAISVSAAWAAPPDPGTSPDEPSAQQVPPGPSEPSDPEDTDGSDPEGTEDPGSGGGAPTGPDEPSTDPEGPEDTSGDSEPPGESIDEGAEAPELEPPSKRERRIPNRYIVVFKQSVGDVDRETQERERQDPEGFASVLRYEKAIKGFAAKLSPRQVARLQADPEVDFVTPDRLVKASGSVPLAGGELTPPTGIRRIEAATNTAAHEASDVNVAVIDTGIQLGHSDLNASHGKNCVNTSSQANDDNGHGTHVAGTIAARNNGSGVVGVAPDTKLYAVKVLNSSGSGSASQVICGIDWVTANASSLDIKVVNMSLGGGGPPVKSCSTTTDAEHKAICRSVDAGVTYVVAAGNSGWDFDYEAAPDTPAAFPEVLTVTAASDSDGQPGATGSAPGCTTGESDDRHASFSNYAATSAGRDHTIAAPGVCIRSTWNDGGHKRISGTSMASPHVAGAVALCLNEGGANGPCSGTPGEIIQRLRSRAEQHTSDNPGFGFTGDPAHPVSGKYFGYLGWVGMSPAPVDTTAPTAGAVSPTDSATAVDPKGNVSVTFSEPMDKPATEAAFSVVRAGDSTPVPGSFSWSANTMTFDPATDLAPGASYTATVATSARDVAGNALAIPKQWSFATIDAPAAPTIAFANATTIVTGSARSTSATSPPRLNADDNVYFEVNSTTSGTRTTAWYGRFFATPSTLSELAVTYRGSNSRKCTQTLSIWDWTASSGAGAWLALDSRAVSTSEVQIDRSPSGALSRFVGGSTDDEVRVQVRCTRASGKFYARGDLLKIAFTQP